MIKFTEEEQQIFNVIKQYAISLIPPTVPRLAGGFVRDKLLNFNSSDIDIALDNMSGYEFASGLAEVLSNKHSAHKIQANPEKSKHLETAVLKIFDKFVDFAQLRQEFYANTRVPKVKPGTPKDDALRRDITINSLFYNLITEEIEDYTGMGLSDLEENIIRTPLDPEITLFEDPLRILRIFRFKAKLNFSISADIYKALKKEDLKYAFQNKVSKERIGLEITKMLGYKHGYLGLQEIVKTNYLEPVLKPMVSTEYTYLKLLEYKKTCDLFFNEIKTKFELEIVENFDKKSIRDTKKILSHSNSIDDNNSENLDFSQICLTGTLKKKSIMVDTFLFRIYAILQFYITKKVFIGDSTEFVNVMIIKESLKYSKNLISKVKKIEECVEYLINRFNGNIIELMLNCKDFWLLSLILSYTVSPQEKFFKIALSVVSQGMQDCYLVKPLLSGTDLIDLGFKDFEIGRGLKDSYHYQVENNIKDKNTLINWIRYFKK